ncbi:glycoside hydrolase N-terminal domain-containing protein [Aeoliella sp. ICT_H6.2]|uniref:Glycoside hydrolase N-terminal domain-containing protein n=1 Tax=Aeoliella straminimaris TaxID=2954799 RepID=A0A9X2FGU2_9BACT|nr:glycoside hydrolase N-terminal domain-containing protein [Aeoliella straminimaris]MCO6046249.1 glycoside hydrolase N-terminal domain-containing protein [Aeoliella straminimaris]
MNHFRLPLLLWMACLLHAATSSSHAADDRWTLRYSDPATEWTSALPIGNGRMGAMIFGGVPEERIQFNEDSVWTGGPRSYANAGASDHLTEIRRLLLQGKQREAEQLASRTFMSVPLGQESYQPLGDISIRFEGDTAEAVDYKRKLDLSNAVATTTYSQGGVRITRRAFASHPDDTIVLQLEADRPEALAFTLSLTSPHQRSTTTAVDSRTLLLTGQVNGSQTSQNLPDGNVSFAAELRVTNTDGTITTSGDDNSEDLHVAKASKATIVLCAASSVVDYRDVSADPKLRVKHDLDALDGRSFETLLERHSSDYRNLFNRVSLTLGDTPEAVRNLDTDDRLLATQETHDPDFAALLFHYGRYLMIASSRPGGQPANLQGLWNQDLAPAWDSKYTCNINTEMNYWLTEPCGLGECNEPLFEALAQLAETGAETARLHYDAPGWVLHHNFDLWRGTAPINASNHGIWPTGGAWLCQHLWLHYEYTGDLSFLEQTAYPLMKGASQFFASYLVEDPRSDEGWLISGPSNSPENGGLVMGPTMDHQIIRDLLTNTIEASQLLGIDSELREEWTEIRNRMAPNQIGKHGQLQEWLEDKDDPNNRHRHVSHLWGLHPGREISPDTPELFDAAKTSLEMRGDAGTGWSRAWKINFWARLRDGDHAHKVLSGLMTLTHSDQTEYKGGGLYENLFDAHPPFQIDGNFGATSGITEMLVQSHLKTEDGLRRIDLLPALPQDWPTGKLHGVRARDGFHLDIEWNQSQLQRCRITSKLPRRVEIAYGDHTTRLDMKPGDTVILGPKLKQDDEF